jgi:hypothetical protein
MSQEPWWRAGKSVVEAARAQLLTALCAVVTAVPGHTEPVLNPANGH